MISLDNVFERTTELGRYQLLCLVLLCIPGAIMDAYYTFNAVFLLFEPDHRCKLFANETVESGQTNFEKAELILDHVSLVASEFHAYPNVSDSNGILLAEMCSLSLFSNATNSTESSTCKYGFLYNRKDFDETVVTRWNLVCEDDIYPKVGLSILGLTPVVLSCIISFLQDKFGRRIGYFVCIGLYLAGNLLTLASPNPIAFFALLALTSGSPWTTCYVWALELVGPSKRTLASTIMCVAYTCGAMSIGLIAYLCRTWQQIVLVTTVPFVAALGFFWLIPESPRWLLAKGDAKRARRALERLMGLQPDAKEKQATLAQIFERADDLNLHPDDLCAQERRPSLVHPKDLPHTDPEKAPNIWRDILSLLVKPNLRLKTILVTFATVASSLAYYTIAYNLENLRGVDMYLTFTIQASMEIPATLLNLLTLNRFGRVRPIAFWLSLTGLACLLATQDENWPSQLIMAFTVLAKLGSAASYDALCQLQTELYPTCIRNSAMTFTSNMTLIASAAMPYIVYSGKLSHMIPMIILGSISIVAALGVLWLPETLQLKQMPQTVEDSELIGKVSLRTFVANLGIARRNVCSNTIAPIDQPIN